MRALASAPNLSFRLQDINARVAALPMVAASRAEHAVAMVQPMVGCAWAGEPRVDLAPGPDGLLPLPSRFDWEIGAYAAALLRKREPAFATGDLSHLRTRFAPPATVLFVTDVRCRRSTRHPDGLRTIAVAEVVLPEHVTGFDPRALPAPGRPLPREVPRLASPCRQEEPPPMDITTDNPPSRKRTRVARAGEGLS